MELRLSEINPNKDERARSFVFWFGLLLLLIGFDQAIKYFIFMHEWQPNILPHQLFALVQFKNYNFIFGWKLPHQLAYGLFIIILVGIIFYMARQYNVLLPKQKWGLALIFAGAIVNIAERIMLGYVRDFLYTWGGGVWNIADFYIVLGVIVLLYYELRFGDNST